MFIRSRLACAGLVTSMGQQDGSRAGASRWVSKRRTGARRSVRPSISEQLEHSGALAAGDDEAVALGELSGGTNLNGARTGAF